MLITSLISRDTLLFSEWLKRLHGCQSGMGWGGLKNFCCHIHLKAISFSLCLLRGGLAGWCSLKKNACAGAAPQFHLPHTPLEEEGAELSATPPSPLTLETSSIHLYLHIAGCWSKCCKKQEGDGSRRKGRVKVFLKASLILQNGWLKASSFLRTR